MLEELHGPREVLLAIRPPTSLPERALGKRALRKPLRHLDVDFRGLAVFVVQDVLPGHLVQRGFGERMRRILRDEVARQVARGVLGPERAFGLDQPEGGFCGQAVVADVTAEHLAGRTQLPGRGLDLREPEDQSLAIRAGGLAADPLVRRPRLVPLARLEQRLGAFELGRDLV